MRHKLILLCGLFMFATTLLSAQTKPAPAGQPATGDLVQTLISRGNHTTFVAALKSVGLDQVLAGPGPFTIFAPIDQAFAELPKGTMENLMKPENREQLKKMLSYHVVAGKWDTAELKKKIKEGDGQALITPLDGGKLHIADHSGMHLMVRDEDDDIGMFNKSDVPASNGVVHVIDNVMMPKQ
jgi:uncharacterized surface protein with fasciclin (FAS1) repeats